METLQPQDQPELQGPEQEKTNWKRFLFDLIETVGLALILFLIINTVSARVRVDGTSMLPTLENGEFVLVNKLAYHSLIPSLPAGLPSRGDIIVFRSIDTRDLDLIKRVIGLPGDEVAVQNGQVSVNGQVLNEPYINAAPDYNGQWRVPQDRVFVLGDNRNNSSDSSKWGFLPIENIIGKAMFIYWPPSNWAAIDHVRIVVAAP